MLSFVSIALACEGWAPPTTLTSLELPGIDESSGLAPSRLLDGALWTHDDDGEAQLVRFDLSGTATAHPFPEATNGDWEDIASAPCGGQHCLYVADIGAERSDPDALQVWVGREPDGDGPIQLRERWELRWPDGPRDAETLLVHPCTLQAWVITRGDTTEIYAVPAGRGPRRQDLERVGTLDIGPVTGGSFAPDGSGLVLRTTDSLWHWSVDGAPDWGDAPLQLAGDLPLGEAVAWEPDGDLVLSSEGAPTPLGRLACEQPGEPAVCEAAGCGCTSGRTTLPPLAGLLRRR